MRFVLLLFLQEPEPIEEPLFEQYVERSTSLTWLKYARWGIFMNGNKYIDCSWLPIYFGAMHWLRDIDIRKDHNSYKMFLLWDKKNTYFDIERWDTIFFLPRDPQDNSYHIAFAMSGVDKNNLEIIDFVEDRHLWKVKTRTIKIHSCWRSYCYTDQRRILIRTNIFE